MSICCVLQILPHAQIVDNNRIQDKNTNRAKHYDHRTELKK